MSTRSLRLMLAAGLTAGSLLAACSGEGPTDGPDRASADVAAVVDEWVTASPQHRDVRADAGRRAAAHHDLAPRSPGDPRRLDVCRLHVRRSTPVA